MRNNFDAGVNYCNQGNDYLKKVIITACRYSENSSKRPPNNALNQISSFNEYFRSEREITESK